MRYEVEEGDTRYISLLATLEKVMSIKEFSLHRLDGEDTA